jgi:hypothetical protein
MPPAQRHNRGNIPLAKKTLLCKFIRTDGITPAKDISLDNNEFLFWISVISLT